MAEVTPKVCPNLRVFPLGCINLLTKLKANIRPFPLDCQTSWSKFARRLGFEGFRRPKVPKTRRKVTIPDGVSEIEPAAVKHFRLDEALGERLKIKDR